MTVPCACSLSRVPGRGASGRWILLALASWMILAFLAMPLAAANQNDGIESGRKALTSLQQDKKKAAVRQNWLDVEAKFQQVLDAAPSGPTAPVALYWLGRVNESLGQRSGMDPDYARAADFYAKAAAKFPKSSLAPECLLRRARLNMEELDQRDEAYADLVLIDHRYPKSSEAKTARDILGTLDKNRKSSGRSDSAPPKSADKASGKSSDKEDAKPAGKASDKDDGKPAVCPAPRDGKTAELRSIRYQSGEATSRVILELDREVAYAHQRASSDSGQPRMILELRGAAPGRGVKGELKVSQGMLRAVVCDQAGDGPVRVALDFRTLSDVKVHTQDDPFRIVVDGKASGKAAKKGDSFVVAGVAGAAGSGKDMLAVGRDDAKPQVLAPVQDDDKRKPSQGKTGYKPPASGKKLAKNLVEQLGLSVHRIMIDPGHGGKDPGASGFGQREKDINLRMAKLLGAELAARGFEVIFTRTKDVFIPLEERTAMANDRKADMFVSIHCNANNDQGVSGIETYSLNLAKSEDAVKVAARENAASGKQISDLQFILTDLMLNSKVKESCDLAGHVQSHSVLTLKRFRTNNHGTKEAPFYVLMGARMPAVLAEIGYITNREEASRLGSDAYLKDLAKGMADGIMAYKRQIERFASL